MTGAEQKPRRLARWVEPPLTEAQLARQWSAIRDRRGRRRLSLGWWAAGGSALLAAATLAIVQPWASGDGGSAVTGAIVSSAPGAIVESGAQAIAVHLADGSQIDLDARTRLEAAEAPGRDVRFELRHGRATFEVARDPGRRFAVAAGAVRVIVVGTRFSVQHADGQVAVRVERGIVEVQTERGARRLGAGEAWSGAAGASDERVDGEVEIGSIGAAAAEGDEAPARPRRDGPSATELFEEAREARRDGREADAARTYEQLLRRHPRDGHAGLAAFELARIRMDVLGDPRGAIEPLERAIAARVFREDAMARLVRAYDAVGQPARCRGARDHYVTAYPEGVHRAAVEASCSE